MDAGEAGGRRLKRLRKNWFVVEALQLLKLTLPTLLGYLFQQLIFVVSLAFCGHVGNSSIVLEAVALAQSVMDILALSVVFGFGTALDTLASQAWGAKRYKKVGVYFQRSLLIHLLLMGVVWAVCFNAETILNLFQQPPQVVQLAIQYVWLFAAAVPAVYISVLLTKYFEAQNIVFPLIIPGVVANIVNALAHYVLLFVLNLGVVGAGLSVVIAQYTTLSILLVIIYARKLHVKTWGGWSRDCLNGWGQFAMLGIPGFIMVVVEMLSFEIGYYVSGSLGVVQQSIQSVVVAYMFIMIIFPISLGVGISIRVGNELGAGEHGRAKRATFAGLIIIGLWIAVATTVTAALKAFLPRIFTADPTVLAAMGPLMYVIAGLISVDSLQGYLSGVLRGSGKQMMGAVVNFVSYWVIGVPLGIVLALVVRMKTLGYWVGLFVGDSMQALIFSAIVLTLRWKREAGKAQKLLMEEKEEGEEEKKKKQKDDKLKCDLPQPSINSGTADESTPLIQAGDSNASSNCKYLDGSSTGDNLETDEKVEIHPSPSTWQKDEADESEGESSSGESPSLPKVAWSTVVLRIVTCSVFVFVLLLGVALSQLCVYTCTSLSSNGTNVTNTTSSSSSNDFDFALLMVSPASPNVTFSRQCEWDFVHPLSFTLDY